MTMLAPTVPDAETRSERRDAALWVRMNRPGDDNRITPVMVHEINDALDRAENDSEIRAFVLSAEAPVFCLGCDHYELRTLGSSDGRALELVEQVKILCERLERFTKPIIAAVNGNAKGGGFELLLVCDIEIAADTARIGDAHAGFTMPCPGDRQGVGLEKHASVQVCQVVG